MSMAVKDTMNPDLQRKKVEVTRKLMEILDSFGEKMCIKGKALARERLKKPGTYLESFRYEVSIVGNQAVLKFGNSHHAAKIIEEGTTKKGYPIPREPTGVWFFKEGRWIRKPQIVHPGLPPRHIVKDAFESQRELLAQEIKKRCLD